jgi:hypothetical protein
MNSNHIDASFDSPSCGLAVSFNSLKDLIFRHLSRCCIVLIPGLSSRALNLVCIPSELIRNKAEAQPWWSDTSLAAGVLELDCDLLRLRMNEVDNSLERCNMGVRPKAGILGRVAALLSSIN